MTTPTTPEALDEGPNHAAWEQFGAVMESLAETMDDGPMVTNEAGVEFLDALARRGYEVRPHTTPALRDAIALGVAWAAVEAVLPEWAGMSMYRQRDGAYIAFGYPDLRDSDSQVRGYGSTPPEALTALHAALLAREEGSR